MQWVNAFLDNIIDVGVLYIVFVCDHILCDCRRRANATDARVHTRDDQAGLQSRTNATDGIQLHKYLEFIEFILKQIIETNIWIIYYYAACSNIKPNQPHLHSKWMRDGMAGMALLWLLPVSFNLSFSPADEFAINMLFYSGIYC